VPQPGLPRDNDRQWTADTGTFEADMSQGKGRQHKPFAPRGAFLRAAPPSEAPRCSCRRLRRGWLRTHCPIHGAPPDEVLSVEAARALLEMPPLEED